MVNFNCIYDYCRILIDVDVELLLKTLYIIKFIVYKYRNETKYSFYL